MDAQVTRNMAQRRVMELDREVQMRAMLLESWLRGYERYPAGMYEIDPLTSCVSLEVRDLTPAPPQGRFLPATGSVVVTGQGGMRWMALEISAGIPPSPKSRAGMPDLANVAFIAYRSWSIRNVESGLLIRGLLTVDDMTGPLALISRRNDHEPGIGHSGSIALTATACLNGDGWSNVWGHPRSGIGPGAEQQLCLVARISAKRGEP